MEISYSRANFIDLQPKIFARIFGSKVLKNIAHWRKFVYIVSVLEI